MSDKPEVNVQRRRKAERPTSQAARPIRQSGRGTSGSSAGGSSSGGGNTGGTSGGDFGGGFSGGSPGGSSLGGLGSFLGRGSRNLGCGTIALIVIAILAYLLFSGQCNGGTPTDETIPQDQNTQNQPEALLTQPTTIPVTRTPRPTAQTAAGSTEARWLVMVYQDGDDQALEQDILMDLNEMEKIGSTDQVMIVSQVDRYRGGYNGDGNWTSVRRYLVTQDDDLNRINSDLVMDLGEVNMGQAETLVDFVTWAFQTYPADKYVLILSDHGMGWPGGWSDPAPASQDDGTAPLVANMQDDIIYLNELESALTQIQANTRIGTFELIGLDACLMSQMEVYSALQPYARYAVASEETEPGLGWAYSAFLSLLIYDPSISTADLATNIVESYISQDERVVNDQARADFLSQNTNGGGFYVNRMSAEQLASQLEKDVTLTAVDLSAMPALIDSLNNFVYQLQSVNQSAVAGARSYAQSYTSIFGSNVPPSYIDLGSFVQLTAKKSGDKTTQQAASKVIAALNQTVVSEKHGSSKSGSTGIAIYFPNSQLYSNASTGLRSYTQIADAFSQVSLWDDFLNFHYSGRQFQASATAPQTPANITRAPGGGQINVSKITASASSVAAGNSIKLSTTISGENVGYVYFFTGLYDESSNSIYVADTDFLESPESESLNGFTYPSWPAGGSFQMNFNFEPLLFLMTDGSQSAQALFEPVAYGASADQAVYAVSGTYTFSGNGEQRTAKLYFKNGNLFQVMGFLGNDTASAPSEITPEQGDTFTISRKWIDLDSSGTMSSISYDQGDTITFSDSAWMWEQVYAPQGTYLVGFLVSDLDGNTTPAYMQISVN